jgi:hypothetical protein
MNRSRKGLSAKALITIIYDIFQSNKLPQSRGNRKEPIRLTDCLMSAFAMFGLKYASLLQFDEDHNSIEAAKHNLKTLYKINAVPSDTYMRERLDEVDPRELRKPFAEIFSKLQRGKALESYRYIDGHYLFSVDGTGFFSSPKIQCKNCCVKEHKDGSKTYYHQVLAGSIVHPAQKQVISFAPEPIMKSDGSTKNDCETNAAKRLIEDFRREHPHLKIIFISDSLLSKGPFLRLLKQNNMHFIMGAKEGDHKTLYEFVQGICKTFEESTEDGTNHQFRYANNVPLNDSNGDLQINFLDYVETDKKGGKQRFTWVTDIKITKNNIYQIMRGGRARWKIENETFNTLKNQGYHFEHNFGHGKRNLSTVFAMLMMLAFLVDQVQEFCDAPFQEALKKLKGKRSRLWRSIRNYFFLVKVSSWENIWNAITYGHRSIEFETLMLNVNST